MRTKGYWLFFWPRTDLYRSGEDWWLFWSEDQPSLTAQCRIRTVLSVQQLTALPWLSLPHHSLRKTLVNYTHLLTRYVEMKCSASGHPSWPGCLWPLGIENIRKIFLSCIIHIFKASRKLCLFIITHSRLFASLWLICLHHIKTANNTHGIMCFLPHILGTLFHAKSWHFIYSIAGSAATGCDRYQKLSLWVYSWSWLLQWGLRDAEGL